MNHVSLAVQGRKAGKSQSRALRRAGYVPAVVYGHGVEGLPVKVEAKELERVLSRSGRHGLVELKVTPADLGEDHIALIKEVQVDPVTRLSVHADFYRVAMNEPVKSSVRIILRGTEEILKAGWIVEQQVYEVEVECLPVNLPDSVEGDLHGLRPGQHITVSDLHTPHGVTVLDAPELVVAVIDQVRMPDTTPDTDRGMPELVDAREGRE